MKRPILLVIDDDPQVLRAVRRDLQTRYGTEYRILASESPGEVLDSLPELLRRNEHVALLLSDQRMPAMSGVEFLERAREHFPEAKRVLLTAYSDTDAAIRAINDVRLDYYLMKPWDPPEEKLYPVIDDLLGDWRSNHRPEYDGIRVVGYQFSPRSHAVKDFLAGHLTPFRWYDADSPKGAELLARYDGTPALPVVIFEDGSRLCDPEPVAIAEKIGLNPRPASTTYDVAIIGAGPAGLAAAVYGASEGLRTLLVEKRAPGGQAATSSRIENYLGFPTGVSGADLTRRALTQAIRFGTEFLAPQEVVEIDVQDTYKIIRMADGSEVHTQCVIVTTGVDYRRLEADGIDALTGAGVYYGAAMTEAGACRNKTVYIVGGGNSAGQAAMYLSGFAREVHIVIRAQDLTSTMSHYLIEQIAGTPNIDLLPCTRVARVEGEGRLERLTLEHVETGGQRTVNADTLFVFIGARPYTDWIKLDIIKNSRGFIETGTDLRRYPQFAGVWKLEREPYLLETCSPGIFAAGDVRAGAMGRVASAVGEGAMAIKFVHEYLAGK